MSERTTSTGTGHRRDPRQAMEASVTIQFEAGAIVGPGQNLSLQGVFFTASGSLPVTVRIAGTDQVVRGELVRFERMGDGLVGIAVRFLEPHPALMG